MCLKLSGCPRMRGVIRGTVQSARHGAARMIHSYVFVRADLRGELICSLRMANDSFLQELELIQLLKINHGCTHYRREAARGL